ncbi:MAG: hypothetical protein QM820_33110 [Minicystis sp.]
MSKRAIKGLVTPGPRAAPATPGTAAAPLLHWLLVVCGLAVLTVLRDGELDKMLPLWVGAVIGTAMGQFLARWQVRPWLTVFIVANSMWIGPLMLLPVWSFLVDARASWTAVEIALMAFAPAAACGYFSLSERGALLAFWFPAVLWVLSILEGGSESALEGARSWLLLGALVGLLLAYLGARETRRVALWQTHATVPLAEARSRAVLRSSPLRFMGRIGWVAMLGAATLALTGWIAPHLWQKEKAESRSGSTKTGEAGSMTTARVNAEKAGEPCCPDTLEVEVPRRRVREYFPVTRGHDHDEVIARHTQCVMCRDGVPVQYPGSGPAVATVAGEGSGSTTGAGYGAVSGPGVAQGWPAEQPAATVVPPTPVPATVTPVVPPAPIATVQPPAPAPVAVQPVAVAAPAPATPPVPGKTIALVRPPVRVAVAAPAPEGHPFEWMLALSLATLIVNVVQRPVRRVLVLRHLARPFWAETVDQRVSNLWQWMLVGLRDAGYQNHARRAAAGSGAPGRPRRHEDLRHRAGARPSRRARRRGGSRGDDEGGRVGLRRRPPPRGLDGARGLVDALAAGMRGRRADRARMRDPRAVMGDPQGPSLATKTSASPALVSGPAPKSIDPKK